MAEVVAAEAAGEAYDAREAVEELRGQFSAFMDEMRAAAAAPPVVVEEPPTEPAPAPAGEGDGEKPARKASKAEPPKPADEKPAERGYGASWWFGR